jgi:colanic acid/amylovoran biosynthesis glycosyltransferase
VTRSQVATVERPRICYIVSRFPKLSETFILREMEEMERLGWRIDVFPFIRLQEPQRQPAAERWVARLGPPDSAAAVARANLWWLRAAPGRLLGVYVLVLRHLWRRPGELARALVAVARAALWARKVRDERIAHVHAHFALHPAVAALAISQLTGVSFSFTGHSHDIYRHPAMLAEKIRRARFAAVVSLLARDRYIAPLVDRQNLAKVRVVRCGIQPARFQRRAAIRPAPGLCLVTVARLIEVKGIAYFIEACRLLRERGFDLHCRVIGDGPLRGRLEAQIEEGGLGGRVTLFGARTDSEVRQVLGWATAFVLPSIVTADGTMEGVPVSLMEAMAIGVPVIATNTGAIPELVEDEVTGLLVPQRDSQALAAAIERIHGDQALATRLAEAARHRVEAEFDLDANAALLDRLLLSAISGYTVDTVKTGIAHAAVFTQRAGAAEPAGGSSTVQA